MNVVASIIAGLVVSLLINAHTLDQASVDLIQVVAASCMMYLWITVSQLMTEVQKIRSLMQTDTNRVDLIHKTVDTLVHVGKEQSKLNSMFTKWLFKESN